jgi:hypothetical protein
MTRQRQQQYAVPPGMMSRGDERMKDAVSIRTRGIGP